MDAFLLANRAALRRAFFRLTGTAEDDDALVEHDNAPLEAVHQFLQYGAWDAQEHLLNAGMADRWVSRVDYTPGDIFPHSRDGRLSAVCLPPDFLRLAASARRSGIAAAGRPWGRLVPREEADTMRGDGFYLEDDLLVFTTQAVPASGLTVEYHHRMSVLENDQDPVDFPEVDRPLIVAFAAQRAAYEAWIPGGQEMVAKIERNLQAQMARAARRARRTREPARLRPPEIVGSHWFL